MRRALLLLPVLLSPSTALSSECDSGKAPAALSAVSVWTKNTRDGVPTYRISDEDLTPEGYARSKYDRENFVVLLARQKGDCECAMSLTTNRRMDDEIAHGENALGSELGYTQIGSPLYCGRGLGDCGADVPIFRFTNLTGHNAYFAYSLDANAIIPGMMRDSNVLCYGWSDGGSVVRAGSEGECMQLARPAGGSLAYSSPGSVSFPLGTSASLTCENGTVSGVASTLCTSEGWHPRELGCCKYSTDQNVTAALPIMPVQSDTQSSWNGSSLLSTLSSSEGQCSSIAPIPQALVTYTQPEVFGRVASGTAASVVCQLGHILVGEGQMRCEHGKWQPSTTGTCYPALSMQCAPHATVANGKVSYKYSGSGPFSTGSRAELACEVGHSPTGLSTVTCETSGWSGQIGTCTPTRRKRQDATTTGLGSPLGTAVCTALPEANSHVLYIQSDFTRQFAPGSIAFMMCTLGYTPNGATTSTCQNGVWTPVIGSCDIAPSTTQAGIGGAVTAPAADPQLNAGSANAPCLGMLPPLNGQVKYSSSGLGSYSAGSTATLTCNLGFTVSGSLSARCTNGQWTPTTLGTCNSGLSGGTGVTGGGGLLGQGGGAGCALPTTPIGGTVTYSSLQAGMKPSGSTATLTCTLGTTLNGAAVATCQDAVWSPQLGTCSSSLTPSGKNCPTNIALPVNGQVSYSNLALVGPYPSGTSATLTCSLGYTVQGAAAATCQGGVWQPSQLGTCGSNTGIGGIGGVGGLPTVGQCPLGMLSPVNGLIRYSNGASVAPYPQGSSATLTCNVGFTPQGATMSTCQNGVWSPPTLGTCGNGVDGTTGVGVQGTECLAGPPPPLNGRLTYSNLATAGPFPQTTTATVLCNAGALPQGSTVSTCRSGQWQPPTLGLCTQGGVAADPQLGAGNTSPKRPTLVSNGANGLPIPGNAQVTPLPTIPPLAIETNTLFPSLPLPGGATLPGVDNGSQQCFLGHAPPFNGQVRYSNGAAFGPYPSGSIATMTCNAGSIPQGAITSTCTSGHWQPPLLGSCSLGGAGGLPGTGLPGTGGLTGLPGTGGLTGSPNGMGCFAMLAPFGGQISYSSTASIGMHPQGSAATLTCTSGNTISGPAASTCQNGQWQPTIGTCNMGGNSIIGGLGGINSSTQCLFAPLISIGATPNFSGGRQYGPFNTGSTVTISCSPGFTLTGSATASCTAGQWSPLGTCSPSTINNNSESETTRTQNNDDFTTTTLLPTIPTIPTIPTQAGLGCFTLVQPLNSQLNYSNEGSLGSYQQGTSARMVCNEGYTIDGTESVMCQNGQWSGQFGICIPDTHSNDTASMCYAGLLPVFHGQIEYSDNMTAYGPWRHGSSATLTCNDGYSYVSGSTASTCVLGRWTPSSLGTCSSSANIVNSGSSAGQCWAVPIILGGTVTYTATGLGPFAEGTNASLACNAGYTLSGQATVMCQSGGWSPFPGLGSCRASSRRDAVSRANSVLEDAVQGTCLPPHVPGFGEVTFSRLSTLGAYPPGTTATLSCHLGHTSVGNTVTECRDGSWHPQLDGCEAPSSTRKCPAIIPPNNGRITYIQVGEGLFNSGARALLYCDENYAVTGQTTLLCAEGEWQPPSGLGACDLTSNSVISKRNNVTRI